MTDQHFIDVETLPYRLVRRNPTSCDDFFTHLADAQGKIIARDMDTNAAKSIVEMSYITLKHARAMGTNRIRRNPAFDDPK